MFVIEICECFLFVVVVVFVGLRLFLLLDCVVWLLVCVCVRCGFVDLCSFFGLVMLVVSVV